MLGEPHLRLIANIRLKTQEKCTETSERKARTYCYDHLIALLIALAMEGQNDSHIDNHSRAHLRRLTPAERNPGGG